MSRRRLVLVLAVGLALVAACTPSEVPPGADVAVRAALVRADGRPAADRPVVVLREPTDGEVLAELLVSFGSFGVACLIERPPAPCPRRGLRGTTGKDGQVTVAMKGRDSHGLFGTATMLALVSELPRDRGELAGAAVARRFRVQQELVDLGEVRFWEPPVTLGSTGGNVTVDWPALAGAGRYDVELQAGGGIAWSAPVPAPPALLDARVLEDGTGGAGVVARQAGEGQALTLRSALVPYRSAAGAPASRGRACTLYRRDGSAMAHTPCPLTDGDLAGEWGVLPDGCAGRPSDGGCALDEQMVTIDLGEVRPVSLLVVRGCPGSCPVETSADGTTWAQRASVGSPFATLALVAAGTRAVRVRAAGGDVGDLVELSLWDREPAAATALLVPAEPAEVVPDLRAGERGGNRERRPPLTLLAVATAALLAAAGGAGAAFARRTRAS